MVVENASPPTGANPLKIGATIPNFKVKTTAGDFKLHDWLKGTPDKPWTIFFSHPRDFTPVCTTELGACHKLAATVATLGCKLIGLSCDDVDSHREWSKDVLARCGCQDDDTLNFPIIADSDRSIVTDLGMLDPEEKDSQGVPLPARALVILKDTTVKLTILYPATTGRNFEEVIRTLVSLQLTDGQGIATPVNWSYGQRVIVAPSVKTEDAMSPQGETTFCIELNSHPASASPAEPAGYLVLAAVHERADGVRLLSPASCASSRSRT